MTVLAGDSAPMALRILSACERGVAQFEIVEVNLGSPEDNRITYKLELVADESLFIDRVDPIEEQHLDRLLCAIGDRIAELRR